MTTLRRDDPNVLVINTHAGFDFNEYRHQENPNIVEGYVDAEKVPESTMQKFRGKVYVSIIGQPPYYSHKMSGGVFTAMASILGPRFVEEFVTLIHRPYQHYQEFFDYIKTPDFSRDFKYAAFIIYVLKAFEVGFYEIARIQGFTQFNQQIFYEMLNTFNKRNPPPNLNVSYDQGEGILVNPSNTYQLYFDRNNPNAYYKGDDYKIALDNAYVAYFNSNRGNIPLPIQKSFVFDPTTTKIKYDNVLGLQPGTITPTQTQIKSLNSMVIPMGVYSTKVGPNNPHGQPVYIEDSTNTMNSDLSFFEYIPGIMNQTVNPMTGVPMFEQDIDTILTHYANYLTHFGKNDGRDTYVVITGCQAYVSQRDLMPQQTRNPLEMSTFFDPVRTSRRRRGKHLSYNPLTAPENKVLSRGSAIFEPDVATGGTRKFVNIKYKTIESASVYTDPTLYGYVVRSLNECFPSLRTSTPYLSQRTVIFSRRKGPTSKPLFFFTYDVKTSPLGRTNAYIYNVCAPKATRIGGFMRNALRLWVERNVGNYDNIVLGVDMKQPAEDAMRLIGIYSSVGFNPNTFVSNIDKEGPPNPGTILLAMVIRRNDLRPSLPKIPEQTIIDNISVAVLRTFDYICASAPDDTVKYTAVSEAIQYIILSIDQKNGGFTPIDIFKNIQDMLENGNTILKRTVSAGSYGYTSDDINDLIEAFKNVKNVMMKNTRFKELNIKWILYSETVIIKMIMNNRYIMSLIGPNKSRQINELDAFSELYEEFDSENDPENYSFGLVHMDFESVFNIIYNIMVTAIIPEYKSNIQLFSNQNLNLII